MEIKVLALDVRDGKGLHEVTIDNHDLDAIYSELKCDTFDIVTRNIGGRYYDIFCDDEGLIKEEPHIISAIEKGLNPMLVGNLMIANHNGAGETTALTAEDIQIIKRHTVKIADETGRIYTALYPVGY